MAALNLGDRSGTSCGSTVKGGCDSVRTGLLWALFQPASGFLAPLSPAVFPASFSLPSCALS